MIHYLEIHTTRREEMIDIGAPVHDVVRATGLLEGVLHLWSMHTTCALTVNENADPDVARDLVWKMGALVPHAEALRGVWTSWLTPDVKVSSVPPSWHSEQSFWM